jgi:hypothetical protein
MDANTITAICALAVSVFATGLGVWSAVVQRKHMRLSVRPIATVQVADYDERVAVYLANNGLGPMLIKMLRVTHKNGQKYDDIVSHMPEVLWSNFYDNVDGTTLENGKRLDLLVLKGDPSDLDFQESRDKVRRSLKDLTVRLEYEDLYGKSMNPVQKELSWFGRHKAGPN